MPDNKETTIIVDEEQEQAQPEQQDLHIAKIAKPDQNWARTQPVQMVASKERLAEPHQTVDITNMSDRETNRGQLKPHVQIVVDRHQVGHEIQPGETKRGIDMLAHDIEYFVHERTHRTDNFGNTKPKHPILIKVKEKDVLEKSSRHREART